MDKKSPIVRVIRRPIHGSDVLVKGSNSISTADDFFAGDKVDAIEAMPAGTVVKWQSFCGVIGTGIVQKSAAVGSAWMVECTAPSPDTWQRAGVPARKGDVCIVYDWQIVRDI